MKIIIPLLLVSLVFLSACAPAPQPEPATSGSESVDELGNDADEVTNVEDDLGLGDLEDIENVLTDIEQG